MSTSSPQQAVPLTIALPKGRLLDRFNEHLASRGISISFEERRLIAEDSRHQLRGFLVKNTDLPVYVHHGIAGLGICGEDVLYESGYDFFRLLRFSFGGTRMCLAARSGIEPPTETGTASRLAVATKFTRFTRDYFQARGIPVEIIKLNGSVELAPLLGLAPYIVDLVETGSTIQANNLTIVEELEKIGVYLIANPAYYKFHYRRVDELVRLLDEQTKGDSHGGSAAYD
jgi:ATP phosphoribosyltransferase